MAHVQLDGDGKVTGIYGGPQPGNLMVSDIADDDPRIAVFHAPAVSGIPAIVQQAMALIAGPVTVASTAVPAINGDYPIDQVTQGQITGIASAINAGLGLPSGTDTFNWPDTSGTPRAWPATQFTAFAKAVMQFLYAAAQVAQGHSTTLPSKVLTLP